MDAIKPPWQPILHGRTAELAWESVRAIAADLAVAATLPPLSQTRVADMVLYWAYTAGALDDDLSNQAYERAMDEFTEQAQYLNGAWVLYGALTDPWVLAHVTEPGDSEDFLASVDVRMAEMLAVAEWKRDYDFIYGLAGMGIYAIDRLAHLTDQEAASGASPELVAARALVHKNVAAIVSHLERNATREGEFITWFTAPELLPPHQREYAPNGYFNAGLAHGVPGVIGFLGRLASTDANSPVAAALLEGAVKWMWAQRVDLPDSIFPSQIIPGTKSDGSRTAWCYGDPGVIMGLWIAARHTGQPTDAIEALALTCANRPIAACGVRDTGLCHGAMGLGHMYNRFYQASGNPQFRDAAVRWFEHGLAQHNVSKPAVAMPAVGGYLQWTQVGEGMNTSGWGGTASFLTGSAGVALALLAALGDEEPTWDRLLLCDLPVAISAT